MAEVAAVGRDHRRAGGVDGGDDVLVAHRAGGLDDRRDPGVDRELGAVGEREEGVGGERRPASSAGWESCAFSTAIRTASTRLICPAPIPIVAPPRASTIAFERTWRQTIQANSMSAPLLLGRLAALISASPRAVSLDDVARPARAGRPSTGLPSGSLRGARPMASSSSRTFFFACSTSSAPGSKPGASSTSMNCLPRAARRRPRRPAVERDHAAVRARRVAGEGLLVGRLDGLADRAAARVVVLDDRAGRLVELLDQLARRGEVEQVVERQLLAVELRDAGEQVGRRAGARVEGRLLVGVLAVAQVATFSNGVGKDAGSARRPPRANQPAIAAS